MRILIVIGMLASVSGCALTPEQSQALVDFQAAMRPVQQEAQRQADALRPQQAPVICTQINSGQAVVCQ